jgi:predicted alpha/beta-fold hydrolase
MMAKHESYINNDSTNDRDKSTIKNIFQLMLKIVWMVWPTIVDKLVLRLFFSPIEYKLNQSEKSLLDRGQSFQIKVRNKNIQCWRWGEGPAVILAHGWNGRGAQFQPLIDALVKAKFSVITFDAPGHGSSQGKTSNYFEFTDTLRILWKSCKNENIVALVGHSLGACAVINFVDKEQFGKNIILISPALNLRELLFHTFAEHGVPKIVYLNLVQNLEMLHGYSIFSDNPSHLIKKVKNDILIFHDKNDKAVPYIDIEHTADTCENVTLKTTTGLGHRRVLHDKSVIEDIVNYISSRNTVKTNIQRAS